MSPRPMQHRRNSRHSIGGYSLEPDPDWNVYSNRMSHVGVGPAMSQSMPGGMGMRRAHGEYQMDTGAIQVPWSPKSHQPGIYLPQNPQELDRDDPILNHTFFGCEAGMLSRDASMGDYCEQSNGVLTPDISPPTTASPLSERPWISVPSDQADQNMFFSKRIKIPASLGANPPVQRSDGVRKKNAKFEIPMGRTIDTIDDLIKTADSPDFIKELKVQKRLLKNREAALQSRQRKKQHTEVLETEKANFLKTIENYRAEIESLKAAKDALEEERQGWQLQKGEAEKRIAQLEADQSRAATAHNNEVSNLYEKIGMLQDTIQNMHSIVQSGGTPISTSPSVTDYTSVSNIVPDLPSDLSSMSWNASHTSTNVTWDSFLVDITGTTGDSSTDTQATAQDEPLPKPGAESTEALGRIAVNHYGSKINGNGNGSQDTIFQALILILLTGALIISLEPKTSSKRGSKPKSSASTRPSILQIVSSLSHSTELIARKTLSTLFAHASLAPPHASVPAHDTNSSSSTEMQAEISRFVRLANGSSPELCSAVRGFDAIIRRHGGGGEGIQPMQLERQAVVEQELFITDNADDG